MTSLCQSWEMDIDNRLQCGITGSPCHFHRWNFYGLPGNKSFVSRKLKTVVTVLNIPMHARTALPRGRREPVEQDATCHGLLVQRQAETNNAAPYLEGIIPTEVWGYLCWVWVYIMSVAIPMCQLVSYSETHMCAPASPLVGNEDVISASEISAAVMLMHGFDF